MLATRRTKIMQKATYPVQGPLKPHTYYAHFRFLDNTYRCEQKERRVFLRRQLAAAATRALTVAPRIHSGRAKCAACGACGAPAAHHDAADTQDRRVRGGTSVVVFSSFFL
jgi:hypothetical protein